MHLAVSVEQQVETTLRADLSPLISKRRHDLPLMQRGVLWTVADQHDKLALLLSQPVRRQQG
jgi:hypothetical protein